MTETVAQYSVPEAHVKMYSTNVRAALNKQGGILMPHVTQGSYSGEKVQVISFLGPVEFIERNTVYGDTKLTEVEHTQRWITGREFDCAILIDRLDTLKMIYDPTSPYVERMREAAARKMDDILMDRFFATAKTGKDGNTDTIFPTADAVAHGATGLTVAKLRSLRKLMKKRHLDLRGRKPLIAYTADEADQLLSETAVNSFDYNSVKPLVDGEVTSFMGFQFIPYETYLGKGIPTHVDGADTIRDLPAWVPEGMHYGTWDALTTIISPRPDKNNIKQIHSTFTGGATRTEEGRVFQVQVKVTP